MEYGFEGDGNFSCATTGCTQPRSGKSKYCRAHKVEARTAWRAMVADKAMERETRYAGFEALALRAHDAGMLAGQRAIPTPMIVGPGAITINGAPVSGETYYVSEGVCGFAWITIYPGNSSFAIWAKKRGIASKAYRGGVQVWVGEFGQSMERKAAYARAYAEVLQSAGITAYSGSRMD